MDAAAPRDGALSAPSAPAGSAPVPAGAASPVPAAAAAPATAPARVPVKKSGRGRKILAVLAVAAFGGGGWFGYSWWTDGRFHVETDDAYVDADISRISARATGYIVSMPVAENMRVKAGDVIAQIDDTDARLALEAANRKVDGQKATITRIDALIAAQKTAIEEAEAALQSAHAEEARTEKAFERARTLLKGPAGTQQVMDEATAAHDKAVAAVASAVAALDAAHAQVDVLKAQRAEAEATLAGLQTAVSIAERDLGFTRITAPVDGVFGNKAVDLGALVQPGTRVGAVVPLDDLHVEANFKETQLGQLRPGQEVVISVDALPDETFRGVVESVAPGSGATFSLLPPENATGNFTKITQRVPVRIRIDQSSDPHGLLRPGLSVVTRVDVRTGNPVVAGGAAAATGQTP